MAKKSTRKGSDFERRVAKLFGQSWDIAFERTPQSGGWGKMRTKGDLVAPPEIPFRFHFECKNQEGWQFDCLLSGKGDKKLLLWWKQCTDQAEEDSREPLLVFTRNLAPTYVRWYPRGAKEANISPYLQMPDGSRVVTVEAFLGTVRRLDVIPPVL